MMDEIRKNLDDYYNNINNYNKQKSKEMSYWISTARKYDLISDTNASKMSDGKLQSGLTAN